MDTTLARPPIGQLLDGRYRVASHLARGGMATVYLGTDTRLDRTVALKIMHAELANDEDFVRRFVAEARSIARLSHPNVVTVYDQGADGRTLYLAMEYVPGRTLRDLLHERGRLGPREALGIMDGVLAGLAAAHAAGIAHRDVKPENVLLGDAHTIKVADFGLARMLAGVSHTKSGMIIGTAAYLAPEQVSGGRADARTDVYAAGVMLFELLTGGVPYTGDTPLAVAYRHVNEVVPPPSSIVPGLPAALDALVALATSRDPDLRPADAGQFLQAINGVRNGLPPGAPPPGALPPGAPPLGAPPLGALPPGGTDGRAHQLSSSADTLPPRTGGGWQAGAPDAPGPAPGWGGSPGGQPDPGPELVPGLPARPSFGTPRNGLAGPVGTQQPPPEQPGTHKTLIVSGGAYPGMRDTGPLGPLPPREPRLQRLLYSRRLAYLALVLAVVLVAGLLGWWVFEGRYTSVPGVSGLTAAAARADLGNAGLKAVTGKPQIDNRVRKGLVIRTNPAAGARIFRGGRVTLVVSAGPHMITMLQVTGQPLAQAQAALRHAGLVPGPVRHTTSATIAAGIVISTRPSAGTSWPQPQPVTLVVSAGPPMPNFVGQQKSVAEGWAQQNGIQLNEVPAHKSSQPANTVVHQSLPPGHAFSQHQVITIVYSQGPPPEQIPNVDGMDYHKATDMLTKLGFQVQIQGLPIFKTVISYSPSGAAPKGSTITLILGP